MNFVMEDLRVFSYLNEFLNEWLNAECSAESCNIYFYGDLNCSIVVYSFARP